ncbi:MAG: large-conductance mechanosensitive channel protein MscL [Erysipelotrichaceae bacterium]|nr:large-conductance mechanosensitive channel protein MscL [Erysipelotrichaceae bacterium]
MKNMVKEFKEFIMRGNVIDLAVAVIIGGAFQAIIGSLVNDIFMPIIGMIIGGHDFSELSVTVGTATLAYGNFIQAIINFLAIALCLFTVIKTVNKLKKPKAPEPAKPAAKPDDVVLLEEIRDLLKKQQNNRPAQRSNSGNRNNPRRNNKKEDNPEAPKEA